MLLHWRPVSIQGLSGFGKNGFPFLARGQDAWIGLDIAKEPDENARYEYRLAKVGEQQRPL